MIPIAGSAYTYAYATMGELLAWIIGWDLVLEYAVGAATVSVSWSSYVVKLLHTFGYQLPPSLTARSMPSSIKSTNRSLKETFTESSGHLLMN